MMKKFRRENKEKELRFIHITKVCLFAVYGDMEIIL